MRVNGKMTRSMAREHSHFLMVTKYVGKFKNGKMHGQGTFTYTDGGKYAGGWKDDKKHGQTEHLHILMAAKYMGEWER